MNINTDRIQKNKTLIEMCLGEKTNKKKVYRDSVYSQWSYKKLSGTIGDISRIKRRETRRTEVRSKSVWKTDLECGGHF